MLSGIVRPDLEILVDGNQKLDKSEEHTSELQSHHDLVCRLLLEKQNPKYKDDQHKAPITAQKKESIPRGASTTANTHQYKH